MLHPNGNINGEGISDIDAADFYSIDHGNQLIRSGPASYMFPSTKVVTHKQFR